MERVTSEGERGVRRSTRGLTDERETGVRHGDREAVPGFALVRQPPPDARRLVPTDMTCGAHDCSLVRWRVEGRVSVG